MLKALFVVPTLFLVFTGSFHAQDSEIVNLLNYVNIMTDESCQLFNEDGNLRIEYTSKGQVARIDYLFPEMIDTEKGIYYSQEESSVIISCWDKAQDCIEREIVIRDTRQFYERTNLKMKCGDQCDAAALAIKQIITLLRDGEPNE